MNSILIVDDELDWIQGISRTLCKYGVTSREKLFSASNSAEALEILSMHNIDLVLLDLYLDNEMGEHLLEDIMAHNHMQNVVMMTGSNSVEHAVNCMKGGAKDYFIKSSPVNELMESIKRVLKIISLEKENMEIKTQLTSKDDYSEFKEYITCSKQLLSIFGYIKAIAKSSNHILITGESGVGKGVLARIAAGILRPDKPYISVNVAGYDDQMFADTLFGHVKGAFTGADTARNGMIHQGAGGVIFFDEIGDLSLISQVKLLYLLQDGEYQPIGSDKVLKTDAKFIFATNHDLPVKLKEKTMRHDLFFRLNTHCINIPPLRERPDDIILLAKHFADGAAKELCKNTPTFTDKFKAKLMSNKLPGNIRQLRSIIYDLTARYSEVLDAKHLDNVADYGKYFEKETDTVEHFDSGDSVPKIKDVVDTLIKKALIKTNGNQAKAAELLGMSQATLSRRLKGKHNISF